MVDVSASGVTGVPARGTTGRAEASAIDTRIVAYATLDVEAGVRDLEVTSAVRVSTAATPVTVLPDQPTILSVDPPTLTVGASVLISGTGFIDAVTGSVSKAASATRLPLAGIERIQVDIPEVEQADGRVDLTVQTARLTTSEPKTVTLLRHATGRRARRPR